MRSAGTLAKWNDDRGFGFILPNQAGEEIFVHISAFPKDGVRPAVGEVVSFETATVDGKIRAVAIERPGRSKPKRSDRRTGISGTGNPWPARIIGLLLLVLVGVIAKNAYQARTPEIANIGSAPTRMPEDAIRSPAFTCDGRTRCSQMRSYEEALFFVRNCPNTEMDGDGDGEPCESQFSGAESGL